MGQDRQALGKWGETLAARYLSQNGYSILERNARTPYGEVDIIATRADELIFVEVKTRSSPSLGPPEVSISSTKQSHMLAAAQAYLQVHPELSYDWRMDVIAIVKVKDQPAQVEHFENIITSKD